MGRSRDDIAERLRAFQDALGISAAEISRETGISTTAWSNFTSPNQNRKITLQQAFKLKDAYSLTLEYIYDGDKSRLPSDLAAALRRAA